MQSFISMDLQLLLFSLIKISLSSINIVQNAIIGEPLIECGNEFIRFSIKTMKPFQGKIFVKGQYENSNCSRNYNEIDSNHTANSEEIMINSAQNETDTLKEANKTTSFTPSSQSMNESSQKTSPIIDTAESFKNESRKRNSEATMHDYQSNFITTKPLSSKYANFNANHEYDNSIFDKTSTTSHCPPCPTCHDEFKVVDKQREITESIVDLLIKLDTCNIEFEQQIEPRAMIVSLTIVVSFHQNLLTKLDRAFRIQCAYLEGSKAIDAGLDVSMPPSIEVESKINSPKCYYTVKNPAGKIITNARVGEIIEHQWICQSSFKGIHAMLVRNCYAESNDNLRVPVIDENGCTLDSYILPNPQYASDLLSVKIQTPVFKFPDRSEIGFRCDVLICLRGQQDCELITPPKCTNDKRKRRELFNVNRENLILRTSRIKVIDLDDSAQGLESDQLILNSSLFDKSLRYCLTTTQFACIIASTTFLITITLTIVGASIISWN